jgi:hypothetical protein
LYLNENEAKIYYAEFNRQQMLGIYDEEKLNALEREFAEERGFQANLAQNRKIFEDYLGNELQNQEERQAQENQRFENWASSAVNIQEESKLEQAALLMERLTQEKRILQERINLEESMFHAEEHLRECNRKVLKMAYEPSYLKNPEVMAAAQRKDLELFYFQKFRGTFRSQAWSRLRDQSGDHSDSWFLAHWRRELKEADAGAQKLVNLRMFAHDRGLDWDPFFKEYQAREAFKSVAAEAAQAASNKQKLAEALAWYKRAKERENNGKNLGRSSELK